MTLPRLLARIWHVVVTVTLPLFLVASPLSVCAEEARQDEASTPQDPQGQAAQLKALGDAEMTALRYKEALEYYDKAYAIDQNPALLYNRGRALEAMLRYPEALDQILEFERSAPPELRERVPKLNELIAALRLKVATLSITVNVDGARILLRNQQVSRSPLDEPLRVNAGPATLEVLAEGYKPFEKELDLPGGRELTVEVELQSKATKGLLIVKASVPGATIEIDDQRQGTTPIEIDLEAGRHRVRVSREGYETADTTAVVKVDKTTKLDIVLSEEPGILSQWWFWTGVGGVVVTGAVVTAALLIERPADEGTISPHQLSAPLVSF